MNNGLEALIPEIRSDIQAIEDDADIYDEIHFGPRADTIDFIDFHIIDRIDALLATELNNELETLKERADKAKHRLESIDTNLFKRLREQIRLGLYSQTFFGGVIHKYMGDDVSVAAGKVGYDNLDVFINGLLSDQPLPEASKARDPEMVFYQQTPARIVFELADRAHLTPGNMFFDIGSGLGHVPILVNLLTGANTRGIEYEPAYYDYATACALKLNLANVAFINTTAQNGNYAGGAVFFMYTPFEGHMLQQMLEILRKESLNRTIRVFTYGPCSPYIAQQNWLICVNGPADDVYTLYEFRSFTA
jgi:hypothetical protein